MKSERLGLRMIVASLLVIAVIFGILLERQASAANERVRAQGVALARTLSSVSYEQLIANAGKTSLLSALLNLQANPDLGYGVVVDAAGKVLLEVTSPGTIVPSAPLAAREPEAWFGERALVSPGDGRAIREFHAPVLHNGHHAGFVRLGYYKPRLLPGPAQASFYALLALPIFLLAPIFYFLIRREMKPLGALTERLEALVQAGPHELAPNAELRDFIDRFNRVVGHAEDRVRQVEAEQRAAVTSNRLLSYRAGKLDAVLQALPEAVVVLDDAGSVTYATAKAAALLGVAEQDMLRQPPQAWCRNPQVLEFLARYQNDRSLDADRLEFCADESGERRIAVSVSPLPATVSGLQGSLVVFRDVTAEYLAQRAGSEFAAHVSHELKTPLNTLAMYSELLLNDGAASEELRIEAANTIADEVRRMAALINNLLNISKLETGAIAIERHRTKLRDLLDDAFENLAQSARDKGIEFHLQLPPHLPAVALDKDLFRIAINNLLSNAIKYNRPQGSVTLAAEDGDDEIVIRVRDTGIGISAADQAQIFRKFSRGSSSESAARSGHGLGLYLAKEIIDLHQGTLSVDSEPGVGTEFSIRLQKTPVLVKEMMAA
ncbi:MAG TPA: PAS domain-containing sensor histidine kinase [Burkholderiaceae bacterium]|nr:PAS domain-containing sensor histidine kinase [Burkholderiaceae bacterium]